MKNKIFMLLMVLSMLSWAGSWVASKYISRMAKPEVLVFWRFLITFISIIPLLIIKKESFKIDKHSLLWIIVGAVLLVMYSQMMFLGLQTGLAGASGVLVTSLIPIFAFIMGVIVYKNSMKSKDITGLLLGLVAGMFLLKLWSYKSDELIMSGNLYFVGSAFIWALATICSQKAQQKTSSLVFSFYIYFFAAIFIWGFAYNKGITGVFKLSLAFWWNIFFIAIIATNFAGVVYFNCTKKLGTHIAGSFAFLVPVNAVILSYIILDEKPELTTIVGGSLAIVAVYLINYRSKD